MQHDIIIRNATIVDRSGAAGRPGDLAVRADRIAAIGDLRQERGAREIDALGLVLAPGFIDVHTHDDAAVLQGAAAMACKLSQGVTSVVTGNCGGLLGGPECWMFDRFADYAARLVAAPPPANVMALVGHMSLRIPAMQGDTQRGATPAEIGEMRRQLRESLAAAPPASRPGCGTRPTATPPRARSRR
jgi:N-acyl-D-amino-acid deacylase